MTPAQQVRLTCEALGHGGQSKLARMLISPITGRPVNSRTVRRWLAGKSTPMDELLVKIEEIRKGQAEQRTRKPIHKDKV